MTSEISKLSERPKKHHSPWFANKYPREIRGLSDLSPDNISEDLKKFYPTATKDVFYAVTEESPFEGFDHYKEFNLYDGVMNFNPMLMYRLLNLMYGFGDVVGGFIDNSEPRNPKVMVGDWSYTLRLDNNIVAEIRSLFLNTKHVVRFWTDTVSENKPNETGSEALVQFSKDLDKAVSNNLHLFKEKEELSKATDKIPPVWMNSFAINYKSAEQFFELARTFDNKPKKETLQWGENPEVKTVGSMYMASILFYVIAVETLLNIFYEIFLLDEYKHYPYARVTNKADLEIRLSTIHLFCSCFKRQVVPPKSELWKNISSLRDFRNDIVHGNIKDEHQTHCLIEDNILFYYSPIVDFRGRIEENKTKDSFPRVMSSIGENAVLRVKNIVNELIKNLLNAMDHKSKLWVETWLYELLVPSRNLKI